MGTSNPTIGAHSPQASLLATSDLHIEVPARRRVVERLQPRTEADWLIICGDVGDTSDKVEWALRLLSRRFTKVVWVPGNHELWTLPDDRLKLKGSERYEYLVAMCREMGVLTPEDRYPVWEGKGGPVIVAPLFTLYDYSFGRNIAPTKDLALARAHEVGVVCSDEFVLYPDPYPSREAWCHARIEVTASRLASCDPRLPTVLINHFPLIREPTRELRYPEFAQWCGTTLTRSWHTQFRAKAVVYGHLHIPRVTWHSGVRFSEVSLMLSQGSCASEVAQDVLHSVLPAGATG